MDSKEITFDMTRRSIVDNGRMTDGSKGYRVYTNDRLARMTHTEVNSDDKGRWNVDMILDRELLEECVLRQREVSDMVTGFIAAMEKNPMLKMMGSKFGM